MSVGHWRNTYKPVKFFFMDVRVGVVIGLSMLHIAYWTMFLDFLVICAGYYVERIGLGFPGALRAIRQKMAGDYRPALPFRKIRRQVDFEYRLLPWQEQKETGVVQLEKVKKDGE